MKAHGQAAIQSAGTMFKYRRENLRNARLEVGFALTFGQKIAFYEGDLFFENSHVAGDLDEMNHRVGQPEKIVRHARAYAAPGRRMPPMLNVTFDELMSGCPQQLVACLGSFRHDEGHHVLQLIAESISAAQLIEGGGRPYEAVQSLIDRK